MKKREYKKKLIYHYEVRIEIIPLKERDMNECEVFKFDTDILLFVKVHFYSDEIVFYFGLMLKIYSKFLFQLKFLFL